MAVFGMVCRQLVQDLPGLAEAVGNATDILVNRSYTVNGNAYIEPDITLVTQQFRLCQIFKPPLGEESV